MSGNDAVNALVIDGFVSDTEQTGLCELAKEYRHNGVLQQNPSGPLRYRRKIDGTEFCTDAVRTIADKIIGRLNLQGCAIDPYLGWIISYIEPGGFVKPHIDRHPHYQDSGDRHLRCNILVQGNNASAFPVIEFQPIAVQERGLWAFFASEKGHGTAALRGDQPRIVFQYGFVVPAGFDLH